MGENEGKVEHTIPLSAQALGLVRRRMDRRLLFPNDLTSIRLARMPCWHSLSGWALPT